MSKLVYFINRLPWLALTILATFGILNERWFAEEQAGGLKVQEQYLNSGLFDFEKQHYLDFHVRSVPVDFSHQNTDYSELVETLGSDEVDPTFEQSIKDYRFVAFLKEKGTQFLFDSEHSDWVTQRENLQALKQEQMPSYRLGILPLTPDLSLNQNTSPFFKSLTANWFDQSKNLIYFGLALLVLSIALLELFVGRAASLLIWVSTSVLVSQTALFLSSGNQVIAPGLATHAVVLLSLTLTLFWRAGKKDDRATWLNISFPIALFLFWMGCVGGRLMLAPEPLSPDAPSTWNNLTLYTIAISSLIGGVIGGILSYLFGSEIAKTKESKEEESAEEKEYRHELANAFKALESFDFAQARTLFASLCERFPKDRVPAQQAYYLAAAQQDTKLSDYVDHYADTLIVQRDYSRALTLLKQLQQITLAEEADQAQLSNYEKSYTKLLNLFLSCGQLKAAEQCFSLLYQTSPNHNLVNEAGFLLHSAFEKQGLREKAQQFIRYSAENTATKLI